MRYNTSDTHIRPGRGNRKVIQKPATGNQVELTVTATAEEVNKALDNAQRYFAMNMNIYPQRDKTTAQVVEEATGIKDLDSVVENDAVQLLMPYALDKRGIVPAYPPEPLPNMQLKRNKEFSFRMFVLPKPDYELTSYDVPELTVPKFKANLGNAIDRQLEEMAEQNCTYEDCEGEGPIAADSIFKMGLKMFENGVEDERLSTDGRTYIMGQGYLPEDFEKHIIGMKVGETRKFTCDMPDWDHEKNEPTTTPAECEATVVCMQKKVIPAITDEWVKNNIPMAFSLENLKETMEIQMSQAQRAQYDQYVKQRVVESLSNRFKGKIDDAVYESASQNLISQLRQSVAQQNITWEDFVKENGGEQQMQMMLMMQTRSTLVSGYILDAFFRHEGLVVEDRDIREACCQFNDQQPDLVRREFEETGRGFALREMAERVRAQRWLVEHAKITYVDPDAPATPAAEAPAAAAAEASAAVEDAPAVEAPVAEAPAEAAASAEEAPAAE